MAFSIRNIFQKENPQEQLATAGGGDNPFTMYSANPGGNTGSPFSQASSAPAGGSPFGASIFKTLDNEPIAGSPVGGWASPGSPAGNTASPFSPFGSSGQAPLTVADILPQLPPEMVRANGAPLDQQVSLSAPTLEAALRSGQLAVPLFEVYRVCPALFQVPVSPQDPRLVPLPPQKLSALVQGQRAEAAPAQFAEMQQPPMAQAESPFAQLGQNGASPFAAMPSSGESFPGHNAAAPAPLGMVRPASTLLPPKRPAGVPPSQPMQQNPEFAVGASPVATSAPAPSPFTASAPAFGGQVFTPPMPMPMPGEAFGGSPFAMTSAASPFSPSAPTGATDRMDPEVGTPSSLLFGLHSTNAQPPAQPLPQVPSPFMPQAFAPAAPPPQASPPPANPFAAAAAAPQPAQEAPMPFFTAAPAQPPVSITPLAGFNSPFSTPQASSPAPASYASFEPAARPAPAQLPQLGAIPFQAPPTFNEGAASEPRAAFPSFPPFPGPLGAAAATPPSALPTADDTVEMSLASMLKGQLPQNLGFDPNFIPAWINTKLSATAVRQQLPSGRVVIDLGQIIDGTEASFRTVIAHGRRDYQVHIPINEIFHALPQVVSAAPPAAAAPAPHASSSSPAGLLAAHSPFANPYNPTPGTGFAAPVQPVSSNAFDPFAPSSSASPPASPFGGFNLVAPQAKQAPQASTFPEVNPAPTSNGFSSGFLTSLPELQVTLADRPDKPSTRNWDNTTPPTAESLPPLRPASSTPLPQAPAIPTFDATAPPKSARPAFPSFELGNTFGSSEQMLLRALLGAAENLSLERVVELTAQLPGVLAAALVKQSKVIAYAGASSPAASAFQQQAASLAQNLKPLAALIGIQEAETFSITTDERLITFSFQEAASLGILHDTQESPTGLRDKITLISRELARMA